MVEVRRSSMEQVSNTNLKKSPSPLDQAGEGLFAIDALPSGTIVSLFNGVRLKTATVAAQNRAPSDYRIRLNADIDIDIPHECISLEVDQLFVFLKPIDLYPGLLTNGPQVFYVLENY